ncbi:hypothetical protein TEA_008811 [Camellia sinensis var. sinensis]|uniref:Uncharacterized protein n=1 Tax=Camellia sinensis var. sinensis TaxID=542762 RepID=A0A4S4DP25_CAMSN|nr:hypothetical protein TEA_008811 [Camellia sinensis var. sinensis]
MKVLPLIFMIAITMALTITLTTKKTEDKEAKPPFDLIDTPGKLTPSKKVSRFLAQQNNPRSSDHCQKDHAICNLEPEDGHYKNSTCCNNKCVDLTTNHNNCGACKRKCEFTDACCSGKCVDLAYDKGHCGSCGNRCSKDRLLKGNLEILFPVGYLYSGREFGIPLPVQNAWK